LYTEEMIAFDKLNSFLYEEIVEFQWYSSLFVAKSQQTPSLKAKECENSSFTSAKT
jgi:hypothetical protein